MASSTEAPSTIRRFGRNAAAAWLLTIAAVFALPAQESPPIPTPAPPAPASPLASPLSPPLPPPRTEYLGRTIAPTMSWEGGPWLMRVTREKEESCSELITALGLVEGEVVADVGCGNGFYTYRVAKLVGAKGKVFAIDVQPEMLEQLKEEGKKHAVGDVVVPVLGTLADPKLPDASIDLALMVDVYHELSYPEEMLAALKKALKPKGRIVLVEFRLEDPEVPIKLLHKMTKVQMHKELAANGFEVDSEYDRLPWQHVVFYRVAPPPPTTSK